MGTLTDTSDNGSCVRRRQWHSDPQGVMAPNPAGVALLSKYGRVDCLAAVVHGSFVAQQDGLAASSGHTATSMHKENRAGVVMIDALSRRGRNRMGSACGRAAGLWGRVAARMESISWARSWSLVVGVSLVASLAAAVVRRQAERASDRGFYSLEEVLSPRV